MSVYEGVGNHTLVSPRAVLHPCGIRTVRDTFAGNYAEAGVLEGGTALMISRLLQGQFELFYLFDSFQGLPDETANHDNYLQAR